MEIIDNCLQYPADYYDTVTFTVGATEYSDLVPIICPNEQTSVRHHNIVKNGHETSSKKKPQQYRCNTCRKTFYSHTSREILHFSDQIRMRISAALEGGKLNTMHLMTTLEISASSASRILQKILDNICNCSKYRNLREKHRNSDTIIVDETFLKIGKKTHYLIVIISGNGKIMDFRLVKQRSADLITKMVRRCGSRLNYSFRLLVTDGFQVYVGVAKALKRNIIHIRHIHKPPYGRIEIDFYSVNIKGAKIVRLRSTSEISKYEGYFLVTAENRYFSYGNSKRGRKAGGSNRPKEIIETEKERRKQALNKRGRPRGKRKPRIQPEIYVFENMGKDGRVRAVADSPQEIADALSRVMKQFPRKCITTNLVENVFSVLKKLINFRGRRTLEKWDQLLTGYFILRDNPKVLHTVMKDLEISSRMQSSIISSLSWRKSGICT